MSADFQVGKFTAWARNDEANSLCSGGDWLHVTWENGAIRDLIMLYARWCASAQSWAAWDELVAEIDRKRLTGDWG